MNELINLGNGAFVKITMLKGEAGNSIATIAKTSTSGLVDTYTVTLTDGTQTTFQVTNGSSIDHISKTDTQGAIDTYTIYLTDGTVGGTFEVKNATGVIDENFSTSSTNAIQTATVTNVISGVENGATASKSYNAGEYILRANKMYEVTTTVAQDDTWTVGVNLEETNIGLELKQINTSLTANSKKYQASYSGGKYGFTVDGIFYPIGGGGMPVLNYAQPLHTFSSTLTYVTVKDCWLVGSLPIAASANTSGNVKIDGTIVASEQVLGYNNNYMISSVTDHICLKVGAGSTIVASKASSALHVFEEA